VQQLQIPGLSADITTALAQLQNGAGAGRSTFTVGFCFGGSLSFRTGVQQFDLADVIGFYAGLNRKMTGVGRTILEEAEHIHYPALGLFGGDDQNIPVDQVHTFDEALDKAGVEHEVVIYPDAPHSFFDRSTTDFAEASTDAWRRVLGFIAAHNTQE
jgi:carboxymethylenebutenolidase